jgi:hypothetical protein
MEWVRLNSRAQDPFKVLRLSLRCTWERTAGGSSILIDPRSLRLPTLKHWGRPGFDVGREAAQGMPRSSHLVKRLETINANDERFALAA